MIPLIIVPYRTRAEGCGVNRIHSFDCSRESGFLPSYLRSYLPTILYAQFYEYGTVVKLKKVGSWIDGKYDISSISTMILGS
jgi:hypothetical protein